MEALHDINSHLHGAETYDVNKVYKDLHCSPVSYKKKLSLYQLDIFLSLLYASLMLIHCENEIMIAYGNILNI
jgi:hypothetical protein